MALVCGHLILFPPPPPPFSLSVISKKHVDQNQSESVTLIQSSVQEEVIYKSVDSPKNSGLSSLSSNTASLRKKRKVSFAPDPPTSFGDHYQKLPPKKDVSKSTSETMRRTTRSSSRHRHEVTDQQLQEFREEMSLPIPWASAEAARKKQDSSVELEEWHPLLVSARSGDKLSDEESVSSSVSSVTSPGDVGSPSPVMGEGKRRGRPRGSKNKSTLVKERKSAEGSSTVEKSVVVVEGVEKEVEDDEGMEARKTDVSLDVMGGIVAKQGIARGQLYFR